MDNLNEIEDSLEPNKKIIPVTWEEKSGFIRFLSSIRSHIKEFNDTYDFEISEIVNPDVEIDGETNQIKETAFILVRRNDSIDDRTYCLYSLFKNRALFGFIGIFKDGMIHTNHELISIKDFRGKKASNIFNVWLTELVKISCGREQD
ncbi:MAG: hypothetical protein HQK91_11170 [Nitrospirae bacterium]|nr:hypothetical protein [Nitrospirota bacterium]